MNVVTELLDKVGLWRARVWEGRWFVEIGQEILEIKESECQ